MYCCGEAHKGQNGVYILMFSGRLGNRGPATDPFDSHASLCAKQPEMCNRRSRSSAAKLSPRQRKKPVGFFVASLLATASQISRFEHFVSAGAESHCYFYVNHRNADLFSRSARSDN